MFHLNCHAYHPYFVSMYVNMHAYFKIPYSCMHVVYGNVNNIHISVGEMFCIIKCLCTFVHSTVIDIHMY
jgi:hypothetical protein